MPRSRTAQDIRQQHMDAAIQLGQRKVAAAQALATAHGWLNKRRLNAEYDSAHRAQTQHIAFLIQAGVSSKIITDALRANNALGR